MTGRPRLLPDYLSAVGCGYRRRNSSRSKGNFTAMPAWRNLTRVRIALPHSASVTLPSLSLSTRSHCRSASLLGGPDRAGASTAASLAEAVAAELLEVVADAESADGVLFVATAPVLDFRGAPRVSSCGVRKPSPFKSSLRKVA